MFQFVSIVFNLSVMNIATAKQNHSDVVISCQFVSSIPKIHQRIKTTAEKTVQIM